ncbi:MAG TPA: Crp/Fnr family transcriptional regulator [Dehalococcoidia bacterium]
MEWPIFGNVPEADIREVLMIARRRTFERREIVFHQHDPAETLHLVVKGRFAVRVATSLGDTAMLAVRGRGDTFGELALLTAEATRSATVAALEPSETLSILRADFAFLQARHPSVNAVMVAILAEQLRRTNARLMEAHYVDADTRVRRRVQELAALYADGVEAASIPLTQEDIAAMAGTSRATVNRVLREDEKNGVLELRRGRTVVRDPEALVRLARIRL